MVQGHQIRRAADEGELDQLAEIQSWTLAIPFEECRGWSAVVGLDHVRVALLDGRVVGGLLLLPMGQWYGGRAVPMSGVAALAIAPEHRGGGAATALLHGVLSELTASNVALSALYPAAPALYRGVGYEWGGSRFRIRLRTADIEARERTPELRPIDDSDGPAIREAYQSFARRFPGYLDRCEVLWRRVRERPGASVRGYLVAGERGVEGYLYLMRDSAAGGCYDLRLTDSVVLTPRAARRLLRFLSDHRSLADRVSWHGCLCDPLLMQFAGRAESVRLVDNWMLRIVDVEAALAARGYPAAVQARLELELHDPLLRKLSGRYLVEVSAGRARVQRGAGAGTLRMGPRGLAALYTAFQSPRALQQVGLLDGDAEALQSAESAFAAPPACMPDFF